MQIQIHGEGAHLVQIAGRAWMNRSVNTDTNTNRYKYIYIQIQMHTNTDIEIYKYRYRCRYRFKYIENVHTHLVEIAGRAQMNFSKWYKQ